jgi:hypothetical protein
MRKIAASPHAGGAAFFVALTAAARLWQSASGERV